MRRWLALGALFVLAGCIPATTTSGPSISMALTTPSTPMTYGWVMIDSGQDWGVQIGPKVDADGTHVAVYAWQACYPTCGWEFFQEWDTLPAGSVHTYSIFWDNGWHLQVDGRTLVVLNPGSTNPRTESNLGEHTTQ